MCRGLRDIACVCVPAFGTVKVILKDELNPNNTAWEIFALQLFRITRSSELNLEMMKPYFFRRGPLSQFKAPFSGGNSLVENWVSETLVPTNSTLFFNPPCVLLVPKN